eukprot:CAMPEP_0168537734 /NCGR_PEP_ID=MMETSP0405-20121227/20579_1 /TAXON_ID=498012 /ORGANISM="Trichosphaerium sp, Strain Am-I-7 wt" /LENGTH=164 /DNA_ID=CAMNT_0008566503 /DNA_START=113 /DNA_END=605 /DNA_ORIENTATION=-
MPSADDIPEDAFKDYDTTYVGQEINVESNISYTMSELLAATESHNLKQGIAPSKKPTVPEPKIQSLIAMGFDRKIARHALRENKGDVVAAVNAVMDDAAVFNFTDSEASVSTAPSLEDMSGGAFDGEIKKEKQSNGDTSSQSIRRKKAKGKEEMSEEEDTIEII